MTKAEHFFQEKNVTKPRQLNALFGQSPQSWFYLYSRWTLLREKPAGKKKKKEEKPKWSTPRWRKIWLHGSVEFIRQCILYSQYRMCDNNSESICWEWVGHIPARIHSKQTNKKQTSTKFQSSYIICIWRRKQTSATGRERNKNFAFITLPRRLKQPFAHNLLRRRHWKEKRKLDLDWNGSIVSNKEKVDDEDDKNVTCNLVGVSFATDICEEPAIGNGVIPLSREARSPPV